MDQNGLITFHPIISSIQKMALYETKSRFYLVGSNNTETRFRVLKIDRMELKTLEICEDKVEYTGEEIADLINMIDSGNRKAGLGGCSKGISAFGIVGFIKFLEGYYVILITKRRKVALIGHHTIYKIEDSTMIYIPHESIRVSHPDEQRYVRMFQNIDLASNFYFSYSYDLTHTLQHNLSDPKTFAPNGNIQATSNITKNNYNNTAQHFGVRSQPHTKFLWNTHLISDAVRAELHPDWILYITHGFIGQSNLNVFGKSLYITLIARRSSKYAGTRFLKRGANFQGDVANEVETEQMVHDSGLSSLSKGHFSSFVQMRGSIPGHWKQEMGKIVAKPAITIDFYDPFAETAGAHFNSLLKRYGSPIVVLNLVKRHERKKQEQLLSEQLSSAVKYLNQFLPVEHQIVYKTFDMARKNKSTSNVMEELAEIARNAVTKVGIFCSLGNIEKSERQTGVIRTNCVDCLDRTNTAQFAIGKCVLGFQLCALGILDGPILQFDTDCVRMLESLYEDHGDTLALQYGGSQLVHRIKTYRKTAPWTSQGNDIMQTLSRYYSNAFSDADKQNAINLFLGLFKPLENEPPIWEYATDYYFHHKRNIDDNKSLTQWYDRDMLKYLPNAYDDSTKICTELIQLHTIDAEMIDSYLDYYRQHEFTVLTEHFALKLSNSVRDFMPNFTTNYSPFSIRVRPGKWHEDGSNKTVKNPSVTGQSSTSSTTSSDDDNVESDDDVSVDISESVQTVSKDATPEPVTFKSLFPSVKETYGFELKEPSNEDVLMYKKYVLVGKKANGTAKNLFDSTLLSSRLLSNFSNDSCYEITPPTVKLESIKIYEKYVTCGKIGGFTPSEKDMEMYTKYASIK